MFCMKLLVNQKGYDDMRDLWSKCCSDWSISWPGCYIDQSVVLSRKIMYTVIHNYGNPYEKWNIFVARPQLWLHLG